MSMGTWKKHKLQKGARASRTTSGKARITFVHPPESGWPGGRPEDNGYRRKGGK